MLLPFDPLGPRALSITLMVLTILVTMADSGPRTSSLVSNTSSYVNCFGAGAGNQFQCGTGTRNQISGGNLTVGKF